MVDIILVHVLYSLNIIVIYTCMLLRKQGHIVLHNNYSVSYVRYVPHPQLISLYLPYSDILYLPMHVHNFFQISKDFYSELEPDSQQKIFASLVDTLVISPNPEVSNKVRKIMKHVSACNIITIV